MPPRSPVLMALIGVAVVALGIVAFAMSSNDGDSQAAVLPVELADRNPQSLLSRSRPFILGDSTAPVILVEFGDFACPGCADFYRLTKPRLDSAYVQTGQVEYRFYDYPLLNLHPHAFLGARAAHCAADQGAYWEYHDQLFRNQAEWSLAVQAGTYMERYAEALGLDEDAFSACLRSDAHAEAVSVNLAVAQAYNLPGTPSILIGTRGQVGTFYQNIPVFDSIAPIIDSLLAIPAAEPTGEAPTPPGGGG